MLRDTGYRRKLDFLYKRLGFSELGASSCYYCGVLATCEDHSFPLIYLEAMSQMNEYIPYNRLVVVPACHECNSILGSSVFPNIKRRKKFVKDRLRKRYKKLSSMPEWDADDYIDMSDYLIRDIELHLAKKELILHRINY